jgi:hypothetical protein
MYGVDVVAAATTAVAKNTKAILPANSPVMIDTRGRRSYLKIEEMLCMRYASRNWFFFVACPLAFLTALHCMDASGRSEDPLALLCPQNNSLHFLFPHWDADFFFIIFAEYV